MTENDKVAKVSEGIRATLTEVLALEEVCYETIDEWEQLEDLVIDMDRLLNVFCEKCDADTCPAWPRHNEQCRLRDVEDRMRALGIEVDE